MSGPEISEPEAAGDTAADHATEKPSAEFVHADDPDHPGWRTWTLSDPTRFNSLLGKMLVRRDGDLARVRMFPGHVHTNLMGNVHGGALLGFIDVSLFAGARVFGLIDAGAAVTLDLSVQFIGGGRSNEPLDSEVELLRETGRLLFLRGIVHQAHGKVAAFAGTVRKPSPKRTAP
ncbi:PaaI family thioesterase [Sphingomonas sp.]|uniref:PaaI family thioesterase n=1 Tax=Sphingomonas sp. TaxID=28214 RepID=UPI0025DA9DAA|nr:PaaI family thioesterase [Sphingomonas sp.]